MRSLAEANTWIGPVTSSSCTAGKVSTSTTRPESREEPFGEKRGAFGISAKSCPVSLFLSTGNLETTMIPHDTHLEIGSLLFEGIDQIDLSGPFEVLSRLPNVTYRVYGKTAAPVRDLKGLRLTPDAALADAP